MFFYKHSIDLLVLYVFVWFQSKVKKSESPVAVNDIVNGNVCDYCCQLSGLQHIYDCPVCW